MLGGGGFLLLCTIHLIASPTHLHLISPPSHPMVSYGIHSHLHLILWKEGTPPPLLEDCGSVMEALRVVASAFNTSPMQIRQSYLCISLTSRATGKNTLKSKYSNKEAYSKTLFTPETSKKKKKKKNKRNKKKNKNKKKKNSDNKRYRYSSSSQSDCETTRPNKRLRLASSDSN